MIKVASLFSQALSLVNRNVFERLLFTNWCANGMFLGASENAVQSQLWTALTAMLILKYMQLKSSLG